MIRYIDVKTAIQIVADPTWAEVAAMTARIADWTPEEAEARLLGAVADGEVIARLDDADPPAWRIALPDATADEMRRLYRTRADREPRGARAGTASASTPLPKETP